MRIYRWSPPPYRWLPTLDEWLANPLWVTVDYESLYCVLLFVSSVYSFSLGLVIGMFIV